MAVDVASFLLKGKRGELFGMEEGLEVKVVVIGNMDVEKGD
ncbi:hypothetical protein [Neisseria sicca]